MLHAGDEAPDFSLVSDEGETVTLSALGSEKSGASSPACSMVILRMVVAWAGRRPAQR